MALQKLIILGTVNSKIYTDDILFQVLTVGESASALYPYFIRNESLQD